MRREQKENAIMNEHKVTKQFVKRCCGIALFIMVTVIIVVSLYVQHRMMYHPSFDSEAYDYLTSEDLGHEHLEEIEIVTEDGIYHGWGHKLSSDYPTVIYYGGNAQSSEFFFSTMEHINGWVYSEACNAIMIDYPGYGSSEGTPGYSDILHMAEQVYEYVRTDEEYGNHEIIIMGYSLGTGVATYIASKYDVDGLILIAPFDNGASLYNNVCNIFYGPMKLLVRNPYPSDEFAQEVDVPVLLIASEKDEIVPYESSCRLEKAFETKELITVEDLGHDELFNSRETLEAVREYLEEYAMN